MTLDLDVICILGVPIAGIAAIGAVSTRQFFLADVELVGFTCADHKLPRTALHYLASDGVVEETVIQSIDDNLFDMRKRLCGLAAMRL
jgi:hypothetical protein